MKQNVVPMVTSCMSSVMFVPVIIAECNQRREKNIFTRCDHDDQNYES